jgi:HSP20 family molecular chaperone IbpA
MVGISPLAFLDKEMAMKAKRVTGPKGLHSLSTRPAKSAGDTKGVKDSKGTDNPHTSQGLGEQIQQNVSSALDHVRSSLLQVQSKLQTGVDALQDALGKDTQRADTRLEKAQEQVEDLPETTHGSRVEGERQPVVDVFEEQDHVLVIMELPGVEEEQIATEVTGDILTLSAAGGNRTYSSEVVLPQDVDANTIKSTYNNGVLELRMSKKESG